MTVGVVHKPIYLHDMPSTAWQLLWWMICMMDEQGEIRGGWRIQAARDMKRDRIWIGRCAEHLLERGLIDTAPGKRYAKVLTRAIVG